MNDYASFLPQIEACQRSQDPEAMRQLVLGLQSSVEGSPEDADLAQRLYVAGSLCAFLRDRRQAELLYRRAMQLFEREGCRSESADAALALGSLLIDERNFPAAIDPLEQGLPELERDLGDSLELVPMLSKLAWAYYATERFPEAIATGERCVELLMRLGGRSDRRLANLHGFLGQLYVETGQDFRGEVALRRAAALAREQGNGERLGIVLRDLGNLLASQGRIDEGGHLLEEAAAVAKATPELQCCAASFRADLAAIKRARRKPTSRR